MPLLRIVKPFFRPRRGISARRLMAAGCFAPLSTGCPLTLSADFCCGAGGWLPSCWLRCRLRWRPGFWRPCCRLVRCLRFPVRPISGRLPPLKIHRAPTLLCRLRMNSPRTRPGRKVLRRPPIACLLMEAMPSQVPTARAVGRALMGGLTGLGRAARTSRATGVLTGRAAGRAVIRGLMTPGKLARVNRAAQVLTG